VATAVVLAANGDDMLRRHDGAQFNWVAASKPIDQFNPLDPRHVEKPDPKIPFFEGNGCLTLNGNALDISFEPDGRSAMTLDRVRPGARLPRELLDQVAEPLRTLLLIDHARPIPSTLERQMLSLFAGEWNNGAEPRLATRIRAWRNSSGAGSDIVRALIAADLGFGCAEPWRASLLDRMSALAHVNVLSLSDKNGETRTYAAWLEAILAEEIDRSAKRSTATTADIQTTIRALGVGTALFSYKLTFSELGAKGTRAGVGVGAYGVLVSVSKSRLDLVRDAAGVVQVDASGYPVIAKRTDEPWRRSDGDLVGAFGRIDAGLTKERDPVKGWVPIKGDSSIKESTADLGSVEFQSAIDLPGTESFHLALFSVTSFVVGKAKLGNWGKVQVIDSALWELRLASGDRMTAIVDGALAGGPKIANWGSPATRKWWDNWKPGSFEGTVARVSQGAGALYHPSQQAREEGRERTSVTVRERAVALTEPVPAAFAYDSWALDDPRPAASSTRREVLEARLAELRAIIGTTGPPLILIGLTSPEGREDYNMALSFNRIIAIDQAIRDAFGPVYEKARNPAIRVSLGEGPSKATGSQVQHGVTIVGGRLPDPEAWPSRAAYLASPEGGRAAEWPLWRRVDVYIEGLLAVQVFTRPPDQGP